MICKKGTMIEGFSKDRLRSILISLLPEHSQLEQAFLDFTTKNHGAVVENGSITDAEGKNHRIGRLTNFVGKREELTGELIDDWETPGEDLRLKFSFFFMAGIANIEEGTGEFLLPIGVLYTGPDHPDDMGVTHADMLVLDTSCPGVPTVAVWFNDKAVEEAFRIEKEGLEQLDHGRITTPVARSFSDFLEQLRQG